MADDAEVKVHLKVDSNAKKAAEDLRDGLGKVDRAAHKTGGSIGTNVTGKFEKLKTATLAILTGVEGALLTAGAAVFGFGTHAASAFRESEAQVKLLAGTLLTLGTDASVGFAEMRGYASDLKDELEELAMKAGVADDVLVETFNNVIERGGKSIDQAKELTEQMAQAGRAIPGGARGLSEAFEQIEMGVVRAKNPIVGMIASTHMLKGNAKAVALQMQKMTPEEQMKLAEKAIARMGDRMKTVPLSFGEMTTAMKVAWDNVWEAAGEPIMRSVGPIVGKIRDFFMENKDAITGVAESFGSAIGEVVDNAGPTLDALFKAMRESSEDFKSSWNEIKGPVKELFQYMYENREEFSQGFVEILKMIAKVAAGLVRAMKEVYDIIKGAYNLLATATIAGRHVLGPVLGPGAARGAAQSSLQQATMMAGGGLGIKAGVPKKADLDKQREDYVKAMVAAGDDRTFAEADFDKAVQRAADEHAATMKQVGALQQGAMAGSASDFAKAFDIATNAHDKSAQQYALTFLANSGQLRDVMAKAGPEIVTTGFEGMIDALEEFAPELAKALKAARGATRTGVPTKAQVNNTFTGPINIKQDFKDEDPDRIVAIFKRDLAEAGANRVRAIGSPGFGF